MASAGVPVGSLELAHSIDGHLKPLLCVADVSGNGERGEQAGVRDEPYCCCF